MTVPLMVLRRGRAGRRVLERRIRSRWSRFDGFVAPIFASVGQAIGQVAHREGYETHSWHWASPLRWRGCGAAYWMYVMRQRRAGATAGRDACRASTGQPRTSGASTSCTTRRVLGAVDVAGRLVRLGRQVGRRRHPSPACQLLRVVASGTVLRAAPDGRVQAYAAVDGRGAGRGGWFLAGARTRRPDVEQPRVSGAATSSSAAPGLGYQYRWDRDGDGQGRQSRLVRRRRPTRAR